MTEMRDASSVELSLPADPDHLRLVRLTVADAAARAGFDYEEIDDLRLAVTEMCTLLTDPEARLVLELVAESRQLTVRGQVPRATLPTVGELTERILGAVVDTHQLELSDGTARFVLVKQARATPA